MARINTNIASLVAQKNLGRANDDLQALQGKAEVAAFCSQYIEWQRDDGSDVAATRMKSLVQEMVAS